MSWPLATPAARCARSGRACRFRRWPEQMRPEIQQGVVIRNGDVLRLAASLWRSFITLVAGTLLLAVMKLADLAAPLAIIGLIVWLIFGMAISGLQTA